LALTFGKSLMDEYGHQAVLDQVGALLRSRASQGASSPTARR
jgi:hypothetical protein